MPTSSSLISCICQHPKYKKNTFISRLATFEQLISTVKCVFGIPKGVGFTVCYMQKYESGQTRIGEIHADVWGDVAANAEEITIEIGSKIIARKEPPEYEEVEAEEIVEEEISEEEEEEPVRRPKKQKKAKIPPFPKPYPDGLPFGASGPHRDDFKGRREEMDRRIQRGEKCGACEESGELCQVDMRTERRVKCRACHNGGLKCYFMRTKLRNEEEEGEVGGKGTMDEGKLECEEEEEDENLMMD